MKFNFYNLDSNYTNSYRSASFIDISKDIDFIPIAFIPTFYSNLNSIFKHKNIKDYIKDYDINNLKNHIYSYLECSNINPSFPKTNNRDFYIYGGPSIKDHFEKSITFRGVGYGSVSVGISNHFIKSKNNSDIYYFLAIKKEDLALYKKCAIFQDEFPDEKLYCFFDKVKMTKALRNAWLAKELYSLINTDINCVPEQNVKICSNLNSFLIKPKTLPKLNSISLKKEYNTFIKNSIFSYLNNGNVLEMPNKFKKTIIGYSSTIVDKIYLDINTKITIKTMRTINIKKSELATLIGLGENVKSIATRLNVNEKDIKECMITFNLIKTRKAPKSYIINLEEYV